MSRPEDNLIDGMPLGPELFKHFMSNPELCKFDNLVNMPNGQLGPVESVFRTPEECFKDLPDYAFEPNYYQLKQHGSIRMHYLDEGPKDAKETILLVHGEPCWNYVYRHMVPILAAAGFRVIAPDLVGFGKSDKPTKRTDYSIERQVDWLSELVLGLDLDNINVLIHDWGGFPGLRTVARYPERFLRVALTVTGLPEGNGAAAMFAVWSGQISQKIPKWGPMIQSQVTRVMSDEECAAYDAPFPSEEYRVMTRVAPQLATLPGDNPSVEENRGAIRRVFKQWQKPFITIWNKDEVVGAESNEGGASKWREMIPHCKHHVVNEGGPEAGHFIQEDCGEEICQTLLKFIEENPVELNSGVTKIES